MCAHLLVGHDLDRELFAWGKWDVDLHVSGRVCCGKLMTGGCGRDRATVSGRMEACTGSQ